MLTKHKQRDKIDVARKLWLFLVCYYWYAIIVNFDEVEKVRTKITLACTECKQRNYETKKERKNHPDRMEFKKHCKFCNKHTLHRETR